MIGSFSQRNATTDLHMPCGALPSIFILNVDSKKFIDENLSFLIIKANGKQTINLGAWSEDFRPPCLGLLFPMYALCSGVGLRRHLGQFYLFIVNNKYVRFNMFSLGFMRQEKRTRTQMAFRPN